MLPPHLLGPGLHVQVLVLSRPRGRSELQSPLHWTGRVVFVEWTSVPLLRTKYPKVLPTLVPVIVHSQDFTVYFLTKSHTTNTRTP